MCYSNVHQFINAMRTFRDIPSLNQEEPSMLSVIKKLYTLYPPVVCLIPKDFINDE